MSAETVFNDDLGELSSELCTDGAFVQGRMFEFLLDSLLKPFSKYISHFKHLYMPQRPFVHHEAMPMPGFKACRDRVMVLTGDNAAGCS